MRRLLTLLMACLLVLTLAACGNSATTAKTPAKTPAGSGSKITGLTVSGSFGAEPQVKVTSAVQATKPETEVVSAGHGNPVLANKKAMFNIFLANAANGKKIFSSTDQGTPTQATMAQNQFFKVIIDGLVGKPKGSRVAIAASVKDVWGAAGAPQQFNLKKTDSVLFVIDVLSVEPVKVLAGPQGKAVKAPGNAPVVRQSGAKVTGLDFAKAPKKAPTKLQVIPLVTGTGPAAKAGRLVTFNYYGAVWRSTKPFDSSFSRGAPTPFGVGVHGLIPAWDKVIPGLRQGSRVLIIAPPQDAYGSRAQQNIPANSTLTFVVDVLGVDS